MDPQKWSRTYRGLIVKKIKRNEEVDIKGRYKMLKKI
jgi:hypothetical protein